MKFLIPAVSIGISLLALPLMADPYSLQYGGRIVQANGQPLQGPISMTANFYHQASGGSVVAAQTFSGVLLTDGVFNLSITLTQAEFHTVFSGPDVWIEVADNSSGRTYPRQRFAAVPYAFKVPVDAVTLDYNSSGQLNLKGIAGAPLPAGTPADGQILKWRNGTGWEWGSDVSGGAPGTVNATTIQDGSIANAEIAAGAAIAGSKISPNFGSQNITTTGVISGNGSGLTNLPLGNSIDSSGIVDGSINDADIASSAAIAQSKINGLTGALAAKEPAIANGTNSQYLRGDKNWFTLDTSAVPENGNLYYTDARARNAISVTGPLTYNASTGALSIPGATSLGNGYLSASDWLTFSNKQPSITSSSTVNTGTLTTAAQNAVLVQAFGTSAGETGELRFGERASNGSEYVGFKAPDGIGSSKIWTLPSSDGGAGQMLRTDGTGALSWASASDLAWNTVTGDQTMAVANAYVTNSASRVTVTLPASCAVGDLIRVVGSGAGGWAIAASGVTLTGVSGAALTLPLNSGFAGQTIEMVCLVANTQWRVASISSVSPPVFAALPTLTARPGTALSYTLSATDPNGLSLSYSCLFGCPSGLTVNASSGLISWTPSSGQDASSYPVTFSVSNGFASAQAYTTITAPASCLAILTANPAAADGTYRIDPDAAGGSAPLDAYCDMSGGGWTKGAGNQPYGSIKFTANGTFAYQVTPTASETRARVIAIGGGGGGYSGTGGGGGSGYVDSGTFTLTANAAVTIGSGGTALQTGGTTSFGSHLSAPGGDVSTSSGGNGGSGGGAGGNCGTGGSGGSNGGDGGAGTPSVMYTAGVGQGASFSSGFGSFTLNTITAGAGGAPGNVCHGGGGGGGIIIGGVSINGDDSESQLGGRGGVGYGAGGGAGGNDGQGMESYFPVGGRGADGVIYVEYDWK